MVEILMIFIALGITILIHEFGHFYAAKKMGMAVERFSMGLGPKLFGFKKGETEYLISLFFMLGGYVKLAGENPDEVAKLGDRAFLNQPPYKRIAVTASVVTLNFILAIVLMWIVLMSGNDALKAQIGSVKEGMPAHEAGLIRGDIVTEINGKKIRHWNDLTEAIGKYGKKELSIKISRDGAEKELSMKPVIEEAEDIIKDKKKKPMIGISPLVFFNTVESVEKGFPAEKAGVMPGDVIEAVNGRKISEWEEFTEFTAANKDKKYMLGINRAEKRLEIEITPKFEPAKKKGDEDRYLTGISPVANTVKERYGPAEAAVKAVDQTLYYTNLTIRAIYKMITRKIEPDVAGPLGVLHITYEVAQKGIIPLIMLFAIININLALVNFLPLLPFDGGLTLMFLIEWITGKSVPLKVQEALMQIGWALLIFLLVFFTYKDILRIFFGK